MDIDKVDKFSEGIRCRNSSVKPCAGALEFGEAIYPVSLALAVLGDDISGGVLDEGFAGQLACEFFDF
jgi:hypothetical protein